MHPTSLISHQNDLIMANHVEITDLDTDESGELRSVKTELTSEIDDGYDGGEGSVPGANGETNGSAEGTNGEEDPIDLRIRNVVSTFHTLTHIDLRVITANLCHVVYDRSKGVVEKMLRKPYACVKIWSSGKIALTACRSEEEALIASRRVARLLQKILGPKVKFASYRIANIMATCRLPFGIRIDQMARQHPRQASYEPELNTGLIWKSVEPKSTVRIHTTGSIIVTGAVCTAHILEVLTTLYPILMDHQCQRPPNTTDDEPKRKRRKVE